MRTSSAISKSILTLGLLCTSSLVSAFPLIRTPLGSLEIAEVRQELKRSPQGYSVVPVGGSTSTTAQAPIPTSTSAQVPSITTVQGPTATVTDAVTQVQTSLVMSTVTAMSTASTFSTVTVVDTIQPSVTSVPYDNGQWHTTYYFRSTVTPAAGGANIEVATTSASSASSTSTSSSQATSSTTTITDPGQWAPWATKMGG